VRAGELHVRLQLADGVVAAVTVGNDRPAFVPRAFQGRTLAEAATLAGLIFAICPASQRAVWQLVARGEAGQPDWDAVIDERVEGLVRTLALQAAPALLGDSFTDLARQARLAVRSGSWDVLAAQAREAARIGRALAAACGPDPVGTAATGQVAPVRPEPLYEALLDDPGFAARPTWQGRPCEVGPLAMAGSGGPPGPAARFTAMALLLEEWTGGLDSASAREALARTGVVQIDQGSRRAASILTSRGPLILAVRLGDDGRAARAASLAPTEWHFHPDGALADAVVGVPQAEAEATARRVIMSLDACVSVRVSLVS
jgi:hypothetical protein